MSEIAAVLTFGGCGTIGLVIGMTLVLLYDRYRR